MNGARAFLELLRGAGVRHVFGNPGSTEIPLLDALAEMDDLAYVLALHEAVALGMADGYAMSSGRLGVFLGHVAPGLGNALGMLHDASKTRAPLLVAAGQQDGRFAFTEPFLWGELVDLARPLTKWAYQVDQAADLPRAVRRAIKVATTPPTGPVFLALPADVLRSEGDFDVSPPVTVGARVRGDRATIRHAAELLARAQEPLLVAGDEVGRSGAETELLDLAVALGAPVYSEPASTTFNFPTQHPLYQGTLAREPKSVLGVLEAADLVCSVGAEVFSQASYAGVEPLPAGAALVQLNADAWQLGKNYRPAAAIWGDPKATLPELTAEVAALTDAPAADRARQRLERLTRRRAEALAAVDRQIAAGAARRPMTGGALMRALVEHAPDSAVILDESSTSSLFLRPLLYPRRIPFFGFKSGGIGWGLPAAVGVAFARPEQVVLAILGDGGALYTPQGLWTAAQHRAKVVFVICNNRQYRIVKHRLHGHGGAAARTGRFPGVELRDPPIDFAGLARSLGVHAVRVEDPADIPGALRAAVARDGPALLDVMVEGSFPEQER